MVIPNRMTAAPTTARSSMGRYAVSTGSCCCKKYMPAASMALASTPDRSPIHMLLTMKGLRMKPHVAPVSFIVCMRNLFEYIDSLTRLLMSDHDINVSIARNASSVSPIFWMPSFTESMSSCWYMSSFTSLLRRRLFSIITSESLFAYSGFNVSSISAS